MKSMKLWTIVLLAGLAVIVAYPFIPQGATVAGTGMFPEWLVPLGYFVAGLGATGLFLAWVWKRGVRH